jgi:hypothetical protein
MKGFLLLIFAVLARKAEAKVEWKFLRGDFDEYAIQMADITIGGKCLILAYFAKKSKKNCFLVFFYFLNKGKFTFENQTLFQTFFVRFGCFVISSPRANDRI